LRLGNGRVINLRHVVGFSFDGEDFPGAAGLTNIKKPDVFGARVRPKKPDGIAGGSLDGSHGRRCGRPPADFQLAKASKSALSSGVMSNVFSSAKTFFSA